MLSYFVEFNESENISYKIFKNEENIIESIKEHLNTLKMLDNFKILY